MTPKTFLDALSLFKELLSKKAGELTGRLERLLYEKEDFEQMQRGLAELLSELGRGRS